LVLRFEELGVIFQDLGDELHSVFNMIFQAGQSEFIYRLKILKLLWDLFKFRLSVKYPALYG
jgi:hypothetical protein